MQSSIPWYSLRSRKVNEKCPASNQREGMGRSGGDGTGWSLVIAHRTGEAGGTQDWHQEAGSSALLQEEGTFLLLNSFLTIKKRKKRLSSCHLGKEKLLDPMFLLPSLLFISTSTIGSLFLDSLLVRRQQRSLSNQFGIVFLDFGIEFRPVFNYGTFKMKLAPVAYQSMVNGLCIYMNNICICAYTYKIQDR